jgi:hypothetical protein
MCDAGAGGTGATDAVAADAGADDVGASEAGAAGVGACARETAGAISAVARSSAAMVLAFDLVSPPWMIGALRPGQGDAPGVIIWVGATSAPGFTMIVAWCVSMGPHVRAVKK